MSKLFRTKNDLPERVRAEIVTLLNQRLADAIDLQSQCKQAHWNVKGDNFIALHELFDKVNEDVEDYVDLIAERSVQLGGTAEGTVRMVAKRSLVTSPGSALPTSCNTDGSRSRPHSTIKRYARARIPRTPERRASAFAPRCARGRSRGTAPSPRRGRGRSGPRRCPPPRRRAR